MTYDLTLLRGADIIDYMLVANYWTDGILFTGIVILTSLLVFAIAKYSQQPTLNAMMGAFFSGFFIALMFWLMPFNGQPSISTYIPFIYAIFTGIVVLLKVRE